VDLARALKAALDRGDYQRLGAAGLHDLEAIRQAPEEIILSCVGGSVGKLGAIQALLERQRADSSADTQLPTLPLYQS
jgi:hypothetical protein